jgi:hypothetical protein
MKQDKKRAKPTKGKNDPAQILKTKANQLDWQNFNFLENLLVFCALKERSAPKESGVHFRITLDSPAESICILFKIDRDQKIGFLVTDPKKKRPDYMSFYVNQDSCICTIIEMKGTNKNSLDDGVEQIITFKELIKEQVANNLPPKLKIKFQGILLTPYNAQIPSQKIIKLAESGFVILPLQYHQKAELYNYISKLNKITEKYVHKTNAEAPPLLIEEILTTRALPKRITNYQNPLPECSDNETKAGIYIDYLLPNETDIITLLSNRSQMKIIPPQNEDREKIMQELESLNLMKRFLKVETRENLIE